MTWPSVSDTGLAQSSNCVDGQTLAGPEPPVELLPPVEPATPGTPFPPPPALPFPEPPQFAVKTTSAKPPITASATEVRSRLPVIVLGMRRLHISYVFTAQDGARHLDFTGSPCELAAP